VADAGLSLAPKVRRHAALQKLLYVASVVRELGDAAPSVRDEHGDVPVEELNSTLADWYAGDGEGDDAGLPSLIDQDLRLLFPDNEGEPAGELLRSVRNAMVREVNLWTGLSRSRTNRLVEDIGRRLERLDLRSAPERRLERLLALCTFLTTLAMNRIYTDEYVNIAEQ
jgi:hypothetical protein